MSSDIQKRFFKSISEKVNPDIIETLEGKRLTIIEENKQSSNRKVNITHLSEAKAFKLDKQPRSIYLFKECTKVNDELIIKLDKSGKLIIFIIEMKSNDYKAAFKQINYGKEYADFLIGILEKEMDHKFKDREYRGYIFTSHANAKKPISKEKSISCKKMDDVYVKVFSCNADYHFKYLSLPVVIQNKITR